MYNVTVSSGFSGAHYLRNYKGRCETLHGHNWKVEATVSAARLDELGLVMDFGDLKKLLQSVLDEFDHTLLNEHPSFKERNPTSEEIASYVFRALKKVLPSSHSLTEVRVWEKENSYATYHE